VNCRCGGTATETSGIAAECGQHPGMHLFEDLVITELTGEGTNVFLNDGGGRFRDASAASGLGPASMPYTGWGTVWADFDNDGALDTLAVNDHLLFATPWLDGPTALAVVASRTQSMRLATTVALPVVRGPVPLAKQLAAIDVLSGGRVVAGVGPGSSAADYAADVLAELEREPADAIISDFVLAGAMIAAVAADRPLAIPGTTVYPIPTPGDAPMGPAPRVPGSDRQPG